MNNLGKTIFSKAFALLIGYSFQFSDPKSKERTTLDIPMHLYAENYEYTSYAHMFIEDFHNSIMPYPRVSNGKNFNAEIVPKNDAVTDIAKEALSTRHRAFDLKSALCDFIREATQYLLYYGSVSYEIIVDDEGIEFAEINPRSFIRVFNKYFQLINKKIAKKIKKERSIIEIPTSKIFYFVLPKELGTGRKLYKMLRRLIKIGEPIIPKFALESLDFNEQIEFDQKEYWKLREVQILRITKKFGWDGRSISSNNLLEYYSIKRFLQYHKAKALIRENIVRELNRIFKQLYGVKIIISGLLTSQEINQLNKQLEKGNVTFKEIVDKVIAD